MGDLKQPGRVYGEWSLMGIMLRKCESRKVMLIEGDIMYNEIEIWNNWHLGSVENCGGKSRVIM